MDFASVDYLPPRSILSASRWTAADEIRAGGGSFTSNAAGYPTANLALFIPLSLPFPYPVNRVFWIAGSSTGINVDLGIYTNDGSKIYSTGSTSQSIGNIVQYVTPGAPLLLTPGRYYLAITASGGTSTFQRWTPGNAQMRLAGCLGQATALPLPATATFASLGGSWNYLPVFGLTSTTTGF